MAQPDPQTKSKPDPTRLYSEAELSQFSIDDIKSLCEDRWWRLNHLYYIVDESGKRAWFRFNHVQQAIYESMWFWNIYLKSRQHGVTTFWCIFMLDQAVWNPDQAMGVIAHRDEDAKKIFRTKVLYPYEHLPDWIRERRPTIKQTQGELIFDNNSSISVGVSMRSGTMQILHISEFGPVCAKFPDKAKEIVTGGLNTVHPGQMVNIESTASGRSGYFYEYCVEAHKRKAMGKKPNKLEFQFHFYPWWKDPKNVLDPANLVIHPHMQKYFAELKDKHGISLTKAQKAWYIARKSTLGEDIKQEQPSTWEEAFEASVAGAYFKTQMAAVYRDKRICKVPYNESALVDTYWDLGMNDFNVIWFAQNIGREIHLINYYENTGEGLQHYKDYLDELAKPVKDGGLGYRYGRHAGPHDLKVRELGPGISRWQFAQNIGLHFDIAPAPADKYRDGIQASRSIFPLCWFDEEKCADGIVHLENFRKEWDDIRGVFKNKPVHDDHSHGADGFQTMGLIHPMNKTTKPVTARGSQQKRSSAGWT